MAHYARKPQFLHILILIFKNGKEITIDIIHSDSGNILFVYQKILLKI